jgi:hypothetical protein
MTLVERAKPNIQAAAEGARAALMRSLLVEPINPSYVQMIGGINEILLERFVADFERALEAQERD